MVVQRSARLQAELERIARERQTAEREVDRTYRRELARVVLELFGSCLLGLAGIGAGLHTTDRQMGMIYFWGGLVAGYAGMLLSLIRAYARGEERGDW